ncbi:radical SAM protein [Planctomycetota bacterium]|jgi:radical SAM protein with 4Fe4S-binding SPASM domain|nr:radical SAM protein [Planctomycetota bacterium]
MTGKIGHEFENYLATIQDLATASTVWKSNPSWLEFVPNNVCNLRCIMCGQADGVPVVSMPKPQSTELMDLVGKTITLWTPTALSEPLANDIRWVVEQAKKHEIWLNVYTNAMLLTAARFEMMAERLYRLHISIDSHIKPIFEALRVRAEFETVVANIKAVMPLAKARNIPVSFVAVLMADNLEHTADFIDFLADLGAAENGCIVRLQPMLYNAKGCEGRNVTDKYSQAEIEHHLDLACERARLRKLTLISTFDEPYARIVPGTPPPARLLMPDLLGQLVDRVQREFPSFCSMASHYLKVHPDGNVHPCCRAPDELLMGNVKDQSIEQIWNGPKYQEFRRRMFAGEYTQSCRSCDVLTANPHWKALEAQRAKATH